MRLHQPSSQGVYSPGVPGDGNGDVVGPVASTDGAIALWDGTGGNTLKNSNLVYSVTTLSVPDGFTVSSAGSINLITSATKNIEIGTTVDASVVLNISKNLAGTQKFGSSVQSIVQDITSSAYGYYSGVTTANAGFTLGVIRQFAAFMLSKGAASTLTTNVGFYVAPAATNSGTNRYAFQGELASGAGYNLYMNGTGQNYLAGVLGVGTTPVNTSRLTVAASTTAISSLNIPHGAAPSSPVDGDIWTTTSGLFVRINGSTVGPLAA